MLKGLNQILGNFNITKQFTDSRGDIAYLLADVSDVSLDQIRDIYSEISDMPTNIKTRLLCECPCVAIQRKACDTNQRMCDVCATD